MHKLLQLILFYDVSLLFKRTLNLTEIPQLESCSEKAVMKIPEKFFFCLKKGET